MKKEKLQAILGLAEVNKRRIAKEVAVEYQRLQRFAKGVGKWDAASEGLAVSELLQKVLFDAARAIETKAAPDDLQKIEKFLFFTPLLKRATDKNRSSRITAKVKLGDTLFKSEYLDLQNALSDFLEEVETVCKNEN